MKNFVLSITFLLFTFFSFAGACTYSLQITYQETTEGRKARLTFYVDLAQTCPYPQILAQCQEFKWYKHDGFQFVLIPGEIKSFLETYDTGVYRLIACDNLGSSAVAFLGKEQVYKNEPKKKEKVSVSAYFTVFPNPSSDGIFTLSPPSLDSSVTANFSITIISSTGNQIFTLENRPFSENLKLDLSKKDKGLYFIRIMYGEEIKMMRIIIS